MLQPSRHGVIKPAKHTYQHPILKLLAKSDILEGQMYDEQA